MVSQWQKGYKEEHTLRVKALLKDQREVGNDSQDSESPTPALPAFPSKHQEPRAYRLLLLVSAALSQA